MLWRIPRIWEGGDVWIIGGGPSMPRQFDVPETIIQKVCNGTLPPSAYSPYMKGIHKKHIIGVNMAYKIGTWIDMIIFGDSGFYLKERTELCKFPGIKVSCHPDSRNESWIKYVGRDSSHIRGISTQSNAISWNSNTGAAAISLAVHTGAKRIILLGFDMNIDGQNMQHWHNLYGKGPVDDDRRRQRLPFGRHMLGFPTIEEDARRLGVEIINASPDSAIKCFPKMTVKEFLSNEHS